MSRKEAKNVVIASFLIGAYFALSGVFAGAGLQLLGIEVAKTKFLIAWVYFNISALMIVGLWAGIWKVLNESS